MPKKTYFGIDWGGTYIKAGLIDENSKLIKKVVISSGDFRNKTCFISKIKFLVEEFSNYNIVGVGIGAPGLIDRKQGSIYYLPNIPGWENYPLKNILKKELKLPVHLENDACCFAFAHARLSVAKDKACAIFLTLGTGVGGAVISQNRGHYELIAAELGHIPISLSGSICGCGGKGCIETFIGSNYLLKRYNSLNPKAEPLTQVKDIFNKAKNKDSKAIMVWQEFSLALGKFLAGMVNIFNPEIIVLGGGVSGAFNLFKPMVLAEIKKQAMWPFANKVKLVKAKVNNAGIIGAALLAKENLN